MTQFARLLFFVLVLPVLWSCGGGTASPPVNDNPGLAGPSGNAPGASPVQFLYVPNYGNSTVTVYRKTSNGNVSPDRTISGPNTYVGEPQATDVDSSGNLYVASRFFNGSFHCCIAVFAPGVSGNANPMRLIGPDNPTLLSPNALAVDDAANIWAVDDFTATFVYVPSQSGNQTTNSPALLGSGVQNCPTDLAFDKLGLLWITNCGYVSPSIIAFVRGTCGFAPPVARFTGAPLVNPVAIAVGPNRSIYVADAGNPGSGIPPAVRIFSYSLSAGKSSVSVAIVGSIEGPHTALDSPAGIAVDADGTVYVVSGNAILVYAPEAFGDAAPVRTIAGPKTGLDIPRRLTLH